MSFYDELETFMGKIANAHTGVSKGREPEMMDRRSRDGARLIGKYGIRADEWDQLAAEAGLEGADMFDKFAQEAVMRYQFTSLYNRYGGRWDGVAVAWKAGTQAAEYIVNQGYAINDVISSGNAGVLTSYVSEVKMDAQDRPEGFSDPQNVMSDGPFVRQGDEPQQLQTQPVRSNARDPGQAVMSMLTSLRKNQTSMAEQAMQDETVGETPTTTEQVTE